LAVKARDRSEGEQSVSPSQQKIVLDSGRATPRLAAKWREGTWCGVNVRVGGQIFPVNSQVLGSESPLLLAQFSRKRRDPHASLEPLKGDSASFSFSSSMYGIRYLRVFDYVSVS